MNRSLKVLNLIPFGRYDYLKVWKLQKYLMKEVLKNRNSGSIDDYMILVEHSSVYTLGRGASSNNFRKPMMEIDIPIYHIERGGDVTWHGPGQLVAYPIIDLTFHRKDLHWLVRSVEETIIKTLNVYGIKGERSPVNSGVWINQNKISAVGITASRWITMHGVALNISCDMKYFQGIIPCGIPSEKGGVCRLSDLIADPPNDLSSHYLQVVCEVFNFKDYKTLNMDDMNQYLEQSEYEITDELKRF